jgi:hypothetical protein
MANEQQIARWNGEAATRWLAERSSKQPYAVGSSRICCGRLSSGRATGFSMWAADAGKPRPCWRGADATMASQLAARLNGDGVWGEAAAYVIKGFKRAGSAGR